MLQNFVVRCTSTVGLQFLTKVLLHFFCVTPKHRKRSWRKDKEAKFSVIANLLLLQRRDSNLWWEKLLLFSKMHFCHCPKNTRNDTLGPD